MARVRQPDLAALEMAIGHSFTDKGLLGVALTHVSALSSQEGRTGSYERLEFLGDRVLGLAVSDLLVQHFPGASEGELSQRLADLVRRETCASVAEAWNVGEHLRFGPGQGKTAGRRNQTILADVCEAIIGATFLDGGYEAARKVIAGAFGERLRQWARAPRDSKTVLQEWAQAQGLPTPRYEIVDRTGPDHAPRFIVRVSVKGLEPADGAGPSKRVGEQAAAKALLEREGAGVLPSLEGENV